MALSGPGGFGRGRRLLGAGEGLATSVVVIALVLALMYAASRPNLRQRWDLTEGARFSLGEQTRKVLSQLPAPVRVTTIFRPDLETMPNGLARVQVRAAEYVRNLLAEYAVASGGRLTLQNYDPHANQNEVEALIREVHVTRYNVVLLQCRDRTRQVFLEDLVTIDRGMADPDRVQPAQLRAWHGEGPLTRALLSVTDEEPPVALVLTGHGEGDISDFDVFGYGLLAESLRGQGFTVRSLELVGDAELPADADVALVLSPRRELGAGATGALARFHLRGGGLLFALDPWWQDDPLDRLVMEMGVLRERAQTTRNLPMVEDGSRLTLMPARRFNPDHIISAPISRQGFFANISGHGGLRRSPELPATVGTPYLLRSEDDVFGDAIGPDGSPGDYIFDPATEFRRARELVMAVEGLPGRVVVFGGSQFLTNSFLSAAQGGPGNMDLALNAVNWLVKRERAVESRSLDAYESVVKMYEDEASTVRTYTVLLMPLGGALLGLLAWFVRRR